MDKAKVQYFKKKLLEEKSRVKSIIEKIEEYENIKSNSELSSELSLYDNHPADTGQQFYDKAKGAAFYKNEVETLNSIDDSLRSIEQGNYGVCKACGKDIPEERLEFIPYTQYCVECKNAQYNSMPPDKHNRPPEEEVIEEPFGYGNNDNSDAVGFDAEDSLQSVDNFNRMRKVYDYGDYYEDEEVGYVENVEKISNLQYKRQLPD